MEFKPKPEIEAFIEDFFWQMEPIIRKLKPFNERPQFKEEDRKRREIERERDSDIKEAKRLQKKYGYSSFGNKIPPISLTFVRIGANTISRQSSATNSGQLPTSGTKSYLKTSEHTSMQIG